MVKLTPKRQAIIHHLNYHPIGYTESPSWFRNVSSLHPPLRWYPETRGYGEVKCWRYPPAPGSAHSGRGDSTEMPLGSAWGGGVWRERIHGKKRGQHVTWITWWQLMACDKLYMNIYELCLSADVPSRVTSWWFVGWYVFFPFFPPCPTLAVTSGRPRVVETTWMRSVTFASVQTALHILTVSVRTAAELAPPLLWPTIWSVFLMIGKVKYPK